MSIFIATFRYRFLCVGASVRRGILSTLSTFRYISLFTTIITTIYGWYRWKMLKCLIDEHLPDAPVGCYTRFLKMLKMLIGWGVALTHRRTGVAFLAIVVRQAPHPRRAVLLGLDLEHILGALDRG